MASWRRGSSDRSYRSSSPSSPATPLSPSSIPQWLRPGRTNGAILPPGRFKLLLLAMVCMMLGWSITTVLSNDVQQIDAQGYDNTYAASTGILDDPTGFGVDPPNRTYDQPPIESQTIKDALGNLHKAVSDKISGWRGHTSSHDIAPSNTTTHLNVKPQGNGSFATTKEVIQEGLNDDERLGARTRIGKCTILFNGNDLWERAIKTHEMHDKIHGYRLHVLRQHLLDDVWSKPAYILSLMLRELAKPESERLEWLLWVDADTILLNPYIPIEAFLPPPGREFEHIHILYSNDWNGLNNGVFPIRVNKWSVELLTAIVAFRYYRPDAPLVFRDQSAMDVIMNEPKFAKGIIQLPQRWFNAYQGEHNETLAPHQIRRGDLLVHFAGVGNRDERMAFWLDRAESHMEDWEVPYKSTSYPEEIKDFWAQQRRAKEGMKAELVTAKTGAEELEKKVGSMIDEFGDRLGAVHLEDLKMQQLQLHDFLEKPENAEDLAGMKNMTTRLQDALGPLENAKKEGHKVLLTSAHDAVFAAEKELLSIGFYDGVTSPESIEVDASLKKVKELILTSEETWNRQQIISAVDLLTSARSRLQTKKTELEQLEQAAAKAQVAAEQAQKGELALVQSTSAAAAIPTNLVGIEGVGRPQTSHESDVVSVPPSEEGMAAASHGDAVVQPAKHENGVTPGSEHQVSDHTDADHSTGAVPAVEHVQEQ